MYSKPKLIEISKIMLEQVGVEVIAYNNEKNFSKEEVREYTEEVQKVLKRFT